VKRWVLVLAGLVAVAPIAASSADAAPTPWENGEPPIILGVEVDELCPYCTALDSQVTGPADGLAFQAASSPYAKGYAGLLNAPCFYNPTEGPDKCPQPLYSGPTQQSLAASWFMPETLTFHVWALREAGTCTPHFSPPYSTERPGCVFKQEVCSSSQTVTLPASVNIGCVTIHAARSANRHRRRR
jgi:hypothetical protein